MNTEVRVTRPYQQAQQLGVSVDLSVNQTNCAAGGRIKGKIHMFVPQTGAYDFTGIHVSLAGYETVVVHRALSSTATSSAREVVRISTEVVRLPSLLKAGHVEYPFCWQLPADKTLPITMICSKNASSCYIKYNLTAHLVSRNSAVKQQQQQQPAIVSKKQPICVIGSGKKIIDNNKYFDDNTTLNQEPKTVEVKSWQKHKGCIELGIETNTSVASPNSMIAVGITGRGNLSSVPVKKLLIQWVETVQWGRSNEEEDCFHRRVLAQATIGVNNAFQWQAQKKEESKESDSTQFMKTMRYLSLNNSARDSYEGHLIRVQHSIKVTAITRGRFATNAHFTTPMQVYRKQIRYGTSTQRNATPIMAKAQLSPITANNGGSNDNSNVGQESQVPSDIEIPQAVPVSGRDHHGLDCPIVVRGEMEQRPLSCCSTEDAMVYSGSSSPHIMPQQEILEPALVLAVVE